MKQGRGVLGLRRHAAAVILLALGTAAQAQDRASDNAITQAEDAFGFSVGRESLGIYSAGNTRGFSPTAAGHVRIDGPYIDPGSAFAFSAGLPTTLLGSSSVKVLLSSHGYPFASPRGTVHE